MPRPLLVDRAQIADLVRPGTLSDTAIAKQLGISRPVVAKVRTDLGLVSPGRPLLHATLEDAYRALAIPTGDGHMRWPRERGGQSPMAKVGGRIESVYRIAFRVHHGREAKGTAEPTCGRAQCVAGAHIEDAVMRAARPRPLPRPAGPVPNGTRDEIIELLAQGLSNREISRRLRTDPKRVAAIRRELGLPRATTVLAVSLDALWATYTKPRLGGHLEWTGYFRDGVLPVLKHRGNDYTARRVAFRIEHGRGPVGRVRAGCGWEPCVAPGHVEDQPMRERLDAQLSAIFGEVAA